MPASVHALPHWCKARCWHANPLLPARHSALGACTGPASSPSRCDATILTSTRERNHLGFYFRDKLKSYAVALFFFLIFGSVPETKNPNTPRHIIPPAS